MVTKEPSPQGLIARLRERVRRRVAAALERRPWLRPAAIAALILIVVAVVPGYIATQPRFTERFPSTEKFYQTWVKSTHAEVTCQSCHIRPDRVSQALHNARMLGEFYMAVLPGRSPTIFAKPPNEACERCHFPNRTVSPSGDLKIPHRAHVRVLKLKCIYCHKYVVHFKSPEGKHAPRMRTCLKCHDGKKAKNKCTVCHRKKTYPVSHRSRKWLVVHPTQQKKIDCKSCHGWVKNWCRECHTRRPRSHMGRWRSLHRNKVAIRRNCEACHTPQFCVPCHGEVPALNRKSAPKFVK